MGLRLGHGRALALCAIVLGCVVTMVMWVGASTQDRRTPAAATAPTPIFGIGRELVYGAPGAILEGRLLLPENADEDALAWRATDAGGAEQSGTGANFRVTLPERGALRFEAVLAGVEAPSVTYLQVTDPARLVARDLEPTGTVLVDGQLAIRGESLVDGAGLDASTGKVSYLARATTTGRTGRLELAGAAITLSATTTGTGVSNKLAIAPVEEGTETLVADVEHLDGTRYVEVETPNAVAMVKGTKLVVSVTSDDTTVTVDHGWVVVQEKDLADKSGVGDDAGPTYDVRDDEQVVVGDGAPAAARPTKVDEDELEELLDTPVVQPDHRTEPLAPRPQRDERPQGGERAPAPGGGERPTSAPRGAAPGGPDACTNIPGVQQFPPRGAERRPDGTCGPPPLPASTSPRLPLPGDGGTRTPGPATAPAPTTQPPSEGRDLCPNIDGVQSVLEPGMIVSSTGQCIKAPQVRDVCPNLPDVQGVVPSGMVISPNGDCVRAPSTTAPDLCTNLAGVQEYVPSGMVRQTDGTCVSTQQPPPNTTSPVTRPPSTTAPTSPSGTTTSPNGGSSTTNGTTSGSTTTSSGTTTTR